MATRTVYLAALALGGLYVLRELSHRRRRPRLGAPGLSRAPDRLAAPRRDDPVREAGPDAMRDPPRRWESVDEQMDETFPASDPPSNY